MKKALIATAGALVAGSASASMISAVEVQYEVTAEDFGGASVTVQVSDLYLVSNTSADVLLNVFDMSTSAASVPTSFYQSSTGTGWLPNNLGGIFDNAAIQTADSFVTVGGFGADALQTQGAGSGTGLDPNFGGNSAGAPDELAGWFNSDPTTLNGKVTSYTNGLNNAVFVGRFSSTDSFSMAGTTLSATWNQGLGTGSTSGDFTVSVIPTPGAVALLGLAGLTGRLRRRG